MTDLFQPAPGARPPAELPAATPYQLLIPNLEKIRQLYTAAPSRVDLAIDIPPHSQINQVAPFETRGQNVFPGTYNSQCT